MFRGWDTYFGMLGTAAAGLIGLLFVVVTLTKNFERESALRGTALYLTPTMVHFSVVLSVSAVAIAPDLPVRWVAEIIGVAIIFGIANSVRATFGIARPRPDRHSPHWSDIWGYGVAPVALYVALAATDVAIFMQVKLAVAALAALLLTLIMLAIRNAWDLVTWMAPQGSVKPADLAPPKER